MVFIDFPNRENLPAGAVLIASSGLAEARESWSRLRALQIVPFIVCHDVEKVGKHDFRAIFEAQIKTSYG